MRYNLAEASPEGANSFTPIPTGAAVGAAPGLDGVSGDDHQMGHNLAEASPEDANSFSPIP